MADRSRARNSRGAWRNWPGGQARNRRQVFFAATFRVMGHIAKADGRVSEEEIRAARAVMQGMRLNSAQMREAVGYFNEGKSPEFDLDAELLRMNQACRGQPLLRQSFVHSQFSMAFAQGGVTIEERRALNRIGEALGLSEWHISQMEAQARMHFGHAGGNGRAGPARTEPLPDAYRALGVCVHGQRPGGQDGLPPPDEGKPPRQAGGPRPARSDDGAARANAPAKSTGPTNRSRNSAAWCEQALAPARQRAIRRGRRAFRRWPRRNRRRRRSPSRPRRYRPRRPRSPRCCRP